MRRGQDTRPLQCHGGWTGGRQGWRAVWSGQLGTPRGGSVACLRSQRGG